jgi:hypothetical protein
LPKKQPKIVLKNIIFGEAMPKASRFASTRNISTHHHSCPEKAVSGLL